MEEYSELVLFKHAYFCHVIVSKGVYFKLLFKSMSCRWENSKTMGKCDGRVTKDSKVNNVIEADSQLLTYINRIHMYAVIRGDAIPVSTSQ